MAQAQLGKAAAFSRQLSKRLGLTSTYCLVEEGSYQDHLQDKTCWELHTENLDPLVNHWQQQTTAVATVSCTSGQPEEIDLEGLPSTQVAVVTNGGEGGSVA